MASMLFRVAAAGLLVAGAAGSARAQAPGDDQGGEYAPQTFAQPPAPYAGPGSYAPGPATYQGQPNPALAPFQPPGYVTPVIVTTREPIMANRFAVGLSLGSLAIAPKGSNNDADTTQFGVGELSLRFRATLHLEIEAAAGGGRQQRKDGTQGDLEAHTARLALRYRFAPTQPWNWWVMGGLGAIAVVEHGAPDQVVQDAQRPLAELGVGIERRFRHFALQAELKAVSVGPNQNQQVVFSGGPNDGTAAPSKGTLGGTPMPPPTAMTTDADHLEGGQFTIGASYYF